MKGTFLGASAIGGAHLAKASTMNFQVILGRFQEQEVSWRSALPVMGRNEHVSLYAVLSILDYVDMP